MSEPISDGMTGGFFDPVMADKKPDGSRRHTVSTTGPMVAKYDNIAGICGDKEMVMFVTSSEWARLAAEVQILTKQVNPENFRRLRLRNLTVACADSDDQNAVNRANEIWRDEFQNRRQRLISGRR